MAPAFAPAFAPRALTAGRLRVSEPGDRATKPRAPAHRTASRSFVEVLAEGRGAGGPAPIGPAVEPPAGQRPATTTAARPSGNAPPAAARVLRDLAARALGAEKRVDALIAAVAGGKTFSASELLALQATVFRYSQTVEILSRTADRLVGGMKQTLGIQV